jgi:hypothetical protein
MVVRNFTVSALPMRKRRETTGSGSPIAINSSASRCSASPDSERPGMNPSFPLRVLRSLRNRVSPLASMRISIEATSSATTPRALYRVRHLQPSPHQGWATLMTVSRVRTCTDLTRDTLSPFPLQHKWLQYPCVTRQFYLGHHSR